MTTEAMCNFREPTGEQPAERAAACSLGREPQVQEGEKLSLRSGRQRASVMGDVARAAKTRCRPLRGLDRSCDPPWGSRPRLHASTRSAGSSPVLRTKLHIALLTNDQ